MPVHLTPNAIAAISAGDLNSKPLVQVIDIKLLGKQERYRFIVSDAVSCQHAMVATQLNDRIKTSQVKKGSIIQLTDYISNYFQDRKSVSLSLSLISDFWLIKIDFSFDMR